MFSLRTQLTAIFSFALVVLLVSSVYAQNLQRVKASMLERKPTVDSLKNKGLVGEGNDGYLHVRDRLLVTQKKLLVRKILTVELSIQPLLKKKEPLLKRLVNEELCSSQEWLPLVTGF